MSSTTYNNYFPPLPHVTEKRKKAEMTSASPWEKLVLRPALTTAAETPPPTAIPVFLYGTAWKKEQTGYFVYQALASGFKGIDTAAQPKHYREDLAGAGLRRALADDRVKREDLYVCEISDFFFGLHVPHCILRVLEG